MNNLEKALNDLVANKRRRSKNENERDDNERRFPQLALARPSDALCLGADSGQILFRLLRDFHFLFSQVGRVGGNRTPIGGFGDRCTAIVLLP